MMEMKIVVKKRREEMERATKRGRRDVDINYISYRLVIY